MSVGVSELRHRTDPRGRGYVGTGFPVHRGVKAAPHKEHGPVHTQVAQKKARLAELHRKTANGPWTTPQKFKEGLMRARTFKGLLRAAGPVFAVVGPIMVDMAVHTSTGDQILEKVIHVFGIGGWMTAALGGAVMFRKMVATAVTKITELAAEGAKYLIDKREINALKLEIGALEERLLHGSIEQSAKKEIKTGESWLRRMIYRAHPGGHAAL